MTSAKVLMALGLVTLCVRSQVPEVSTASTPVIILKGTIKSKKVWGASKLWRDAEARCPHEVTIRGRAEYAVYPTDHLPVTMDVFLI